MRKTKHLLIPFFLLLFIAFSSCSLLGSSSEVSSSSVTVNLPSRSGRIMSSRSDAIQVTNPQGAGQDSQESTTETSGSTDFTIKYNLILATDDGKTYDKITGHKEGPAVFREVAEGTYTISVQALDPNDNVFAAGQSELFQVTGGRESIVDILLHLLKFTVSFEANGGSGSMESTIITGTNQFVVPYIFGITKPAEYVFTGWALSPSAQEPDYLPNQIITLTKDITLYALWSDINASVSSFAELKSAIESGKRNITLCNDITIDEDFTITASDSLPVKINGDSSYHITSSAGDLSFTYVNFNDGHSETDGGMICKTGGSLTLTDCAFINCNTVYGDSYPTSGRGGAIYAENSVINIAVTYFGYEDETNPCAQNGGFAYINNTCTNVNIKASTFSGGYANSSGGALALFCSATIGGDNDWDGCTFQNNRAKSYGGAITSFNTGTPKTIYIKKTLFQENSAQGGGNDINTPSETVQLDDDCYATNIYGDNLTIDIKITD